MSLYGVPAGFERAEEDEVRTWRVGTQLVYALLIESHYPGDKEGIPVFLDLLENLGTLIQDDSSISVKDTIKMFDVIVKENKPILLAKILNNESIPNAHHSGAIAKAALKQAIRVGSLDILEYLISENVQIISNNRDGDGNKNKYDDIRSLIFNILQSVRIGYNAQKVNNLIIANKFWRYLAECFYHLYKEEEKNGDDVLLKYTDDSILMNDELSLRRYSKFMIANPLIICSIYKCIHSSLSGKRYISKLKPMVMFVCEHYMSLADQCDLEYLVRQCENDIFFDCSSLKAFNIKYGHALKQQYGKINKEKRNVKLFWSEYILIKLINDYLGIEPHKINTVKRMGQYGNLNINIFEKQERKDMIYCIRYIVANGAANHLNDIMEMLGDYEKQFIKTDDDKQEINKLFKAIDYGKNIWTLKQLKDDEIVQLFENVCNKQIELPLQLIAFIISFVVL